MRIIDVSLTLSNILPVWPGDLPIKVDQVSRMVDGADANVSRLEMQVHSGTHIDAPVHFIDGEHGVDGIRLEDLIGPCFVIEMPDGVSVINREALENVYIPAGATRILFKTKNSLLWDANNASFVCEFVGIAEDAARMLVERGTRVVGIDYLSIAPYAQSKPTHEILLKSGVVIIEGLDLRQVSTGYYSLICLPLKLAGSDGAPARVVLIDEV